VFELSQNRIVNKRDHIEEELRKRTSQYEDKLNDMMKEVESFRKKEVGYITQGILNTASFIMDLMNFFINIYFQSLRNKDVCNIIYKKSSEYSMKYSVNFVKFISC